MIWGQLQEESESRVQWFVCSVEMWKTEVRIFLPTDIYLYKTGKFQSVCLNITEFSLWPVLSRIPHGPDVQRRRHSETISLPSLWYHVALCVCVLFFHLFKFIYFCEKRHCPQWQSRLTTTGDSTVSGQKSTCHPLFKLKSLTASLPLSPPLIFSWLPFCHQLSAFTSFYTFM